MAADTGNLNTPNPADLNAAAIRYCVAQHWAMDDGSYPIRDAAHHGRTDLTEHALRAVGRGGGSHDAIRRHIITRAKALGLSDEIPDNWAPDGSLRSADANACTGGTLYRSFTPELELRSHGDGRTIVGIAVPYQRPQLISYGLTEQFARGAFNAQIAASHQRVRGVGMPGNRVPFARDHMALGGTLIGRASLLRDDSAGLYGEWKVSATPAGDETLELVRDGALSNLSIAFREGQNRPLPGGVIERVTAELREVAVVLEGAYGESALVSAVRAAGLPYAGAPVEKRRDRAEEAQRYLDDAGLARPA